MTMHKTGATAGLLPRHDTGRVIAALRNYRC
jgi:hypothetical protein